MMKNIAFLIFAGLFSVECYAQCVTAHIDTIEAIVVHKYSNIDNYYCTEPTYLLLEQDTILLYSNSSSNIKFIKEYPSIKSIVGQLSDYEYDFLKEYIDGNYIHNLNFSPYNNLTNPSLKSTSLYCKSEDYLSIYNFSGSVVIYDGINKFDIEQDCPCNKSIANTEAKHFAVLKEVFELKPLTEKQILDLQINKSNTDNLHILICE
jgi:hypothetical protein